MSRIDEVEHEMKEREKDIMRLKIEKSELMYEKEREGMTEITGFVTCEKEDCAYSGDMIELEKAPFSNMENMFSENHFRECLFTIRMSSNSIKSLPGMEGCLIWKIADKMSM